MINWKFSDTHDYEIVDTNDHPIGKYYVSESSEKLDLFCGRIMVNAPKMYNLLQELLTENLSHGDHGDMVARRQISELLAQIERSEYE